jgi:hypothetical protein
VLEVESDSRSPIHILGGVRDFCHVTYCQTPPPHHHSTTFHYNLLPTGAQGLSANPVYIYINRNAHLHRLPTVEAYVHIIYKTASLHCKERKKKVYTTVVPHLFHLIIHNTCASFTKNNNTLKVEVEKRVI